MSGDMAALWQVFSLPLMQKALVMAMVIAAPMALLSCYLVLRGWALMGDALSHAVLPGVVIAYILGLPLALGAFAAGLTCATVTGFISRHSRVKQDAVMGVVFSGMFALGLVLYAAAHSNIHLDIILFGDLLGVTWRDVGESAATALLCAGAVLIARRALLAITFDAQHAQAMGLPVRLLHYGFLAAISLIVVAALKAVGLILAIALLVMPGAIALLAVRRFHLMLITATAIALGASVLGVSASFFLDSAPAPTIVLAMTLIFGLIMAWRGFAGKYRRTAIQSEPENLRSVI